MREINLETWNEWNVWDRMEWIRGELLKSAKKFKPKIHFDWIEHPDLIKGG